MEAYINTYCGSIENNTYNSSVTIAVNIKTKPLWHHDNGLQFTTTGYGSKIPTQYMVRFNDKWRRVYCCIFSNIGTLYIGKRSENLIIRIYN